MLLKIEGEQREREQRVAGTVEVPLPWRAPALGRSPIVTEAMSLSRVKDVATDKGQVLQDSDASRAAVAVARRWGARRAD